jgi:hypothetical protein
MASTYTFIEKKTLTSTVASTTFSSIPQTYTDLLLKISSRGSGGIEVYFNSKTPGSEYTERRLSAYSGSVSSDTGNSTISISVTGGYSSYTANTFGSTEIYIPNYTSSNNKSASLDGVAENDSSTNAMQMTAGLRSNTAAITSIILQSYEGNFVADSTFYLYGIKSS